MLQRHLPALGRECSPWEGERGLCAEGAVGVPEGGVPEGLGSGPESIGAGSFPCHPPRVLCLARVDYLQFREAGLGTFW